MLLLRAQPPEQHGGESRRRLGRRIASCSVGSGRERLAGEKRGDLVEACVGGGRRGDGEGGAGGRLEGGEEGRPGRSPAAGDWRDGEAAAEVGGGGEEPGRGLHVVCPELGIGGRRPAWFGLICPVDN